MTSTEPDSAAGNTPAVTRAIRILDLLAEARGETRTLTEIARELGLAKSSESNLHIALEEGGLFRTGGYLLARRTVERSRSNARRAPHVNLPAAGRFRFDGMDQFKRSA